MPLTERTVLGSHAALPPPFLGSVLAGLTVDWWTENDGHVRSESRLVCVCPRVALVATTDLYKLTDYGEDRR